MTKKGSIKETGEELPQDQWERFEAAVDAAVKSGPKPKRPAKKRGKAIPLKSNFEAPQE